MMRIRFGTGFIALCFFVVMFLISLTGALYFSGQLNDIFVFLRSVTIAEWCGVMAALNGAVALVLFMAWQAGVI